jgi:HAD superfamily hydrolase (TIGR01484 family)
METLYIFDIDGVITNPDTKVPNAQIIHFMAEELNKGWHVAIATGRSSAWVQEHIITVLSNDLQGNNLLDNLFVSCEKGAVTMTFSKSIPDVFIDTQFYIPHEINAIIAQAITGMNGIFFDADKKTMISVEIVGGKDKEKVMLEKQLLHKLEEWVQQHLLPEFPDIHMENSEISMDIQHKYLDKRIASEKLLDYLKKRDIHPTSFVAFGDNPSDVAITEHIAQDGGKVTFVYVGKQPLVRSYGFPVIHPQHDTFFDDAVVQVLQELE